MTETIVDLIRHGEPVGGRRYRGNVIDDPLTEKGWSQMWNAVGEYNAWQQIITSPLQRCQAFAHALGKRHDINVTVEPRFKEVGFGVWEGLTHDEIKVYRASEYHAFLKNPVNHRPQGAEKLDDFIKRVVSAFDETIRRCHNQHCLSLPTQVSFAHSSPVPSMLRQRAFIESKSAMVASRVFATPKQMEY